MAALEAFNLPGFRLEMYPEDHSPPHFHVIKDEWNIRVKFNLSRMRKKIIWESKYPETLIECPLRGAEGALLKLVIAHRQALNKQWTKLHPSKHKGKKK